MALEMTRWDVQDGLQTPEDGAAFIEAAIEEAGDDAAFIAKALGEVACSPGMAQIARDTGINREGLYMALSSEGDPSFATVMKVMRSLGLRLHVAAG